MFSSQMVLSVLPEILILALALFLLGVEPFLKTERRRNLGWLTAAGLVISVIASLCFSRPGEPVSTLGGMIRYDWLGFFFKMLFMCAAAATALLFMGHEQVGQRGEAYLLLLAATLGLNLMASAGDLVMLYLAIETASIPLYVLSGFMLSDRHSTEAGFKYLLFGALSSAVTLYGFSLILGITGTTDIYAIGSSLRSGELAPALGFVVLVLILVGLGFKAAFVPFHFWAPDVYHGAPTPVSGFLSTASKAAGFAVITRLFFVAFPDFAGGWTLVLAVISAITMTVGNLLALPQTNLKRLLAYSSISHAGYVLIGVLAIPREGTTWGFPELGAASVVFYLAAYIFTNLLAFGIVMAFTGATGLEDIRDLAGLSRRSPGLGLMMLAAFLSLAGMPPFAGFVAKVFVFAAGVQADYVWLVVVGIINSIVGVYYYLNVLKYVYLYRLPDEDEEKHPVRLPGSYALVLTTLTLVVILVGTVFAPWFAWSYAGAANLF